MNSIRKSRQRLKELKFDQIFESILSRILFDIRRYFSKIVDNFTHDAVILLPAKKRRVTESIWDFLM